MEATANDDDDDDDEDDDDPGSLLRNQNQEPGTFSGPAEPGRRLACERAPVLAVVVPSGTVGGDGVQEHDLSDQKLFLRQRSSREASPQGSSVLHISYGDEDVFFLLVFKVSGALCFL